MINDWNIITLVTTSKHNTEKDDEAFGTILRRVETRMSENILSTMYSTMRKCCWIFCCTVNKRALYTIRRQGDEILYTTSNAYVGKIVSDAVFLKSVHNTKY